MNSLESENKQYLPSKSYPQVKDLFEPLNISEADKEEIQAEFSRIADMIYGNPQKISNDTMLKIKMGETNHDSFVILNNYEGVIIDEYFDFIHGYPHGEKIWRMLSAYYKPEQ